MMALARLTQKALPVPVMFGGALHEVCRLRSQVDLRTG